MESNKPAQNIQDSFLNTARKERLSITIYLLSGVKLTGRIRSFDKYSVVLEANGQEQLIFKHAISTVVMGRVAATHVRTCRIPTKRSVQDRRQGRLRRPAHRARAPKDKAFSVWEVLTPRNLAARRVLADVCLWGLHVVREEPDASARFWWGWRCGPAAAAARRERSRRRRP